MLCLLPHGPTFVAAPVIEGRAANDAANARANDAVDGSNARRGRRTGGEEGGGLGRPRARGSLAPEVQSDGVAFALARSSTAYFTLPAIAALPPLSLSDATESPLLAALQVPESWAENHGFDQDRIPEHVAQAGRVARASRLSGRSSRSTASSSQGDKRSSGRSDSARGGMMFTADAFSSPLPSPASARVLLHRRLDGFRAHLGRLVLAGDRREMDAVGAFALLHDWQRANELFTATWPSLPPPAHLMAEVEEDGQKLVGAWQALLQAVFAPRQAQPHLLSRAQLDLWPHHSAEPTSMVVKLAPRCELLLPPPQLCVILQASAEQLPGLRQEMALFFEIFACYAHNLALQAQASGQAASSHGPQFAPLAAWLAARVEG